jgi:hypothetical protein
MVDKVVDGQKEAWVAPEIRTLDVAETQTRNSRGSDGNPRYADCTRS